MEELDEQAIWAQFLSDVGSQAEGAFAFADAHGDYNDNETAGAGQDESLDHYMLLDVEQDARDSGAAWLVGKEVSTADPVKECVSECASETHIQTHAQTHTHFYDALPQETHTDTHTEEVREPESESHAHAHTHTHTEDSLTTEHTHNQEHTHTQQVRIPHNATAQELVQELLSGDRFARLRKRVQPTQLPHTTQPNAQTSLTTHTSITQQNTHKRTHKRAVPEVDLFADVSPDTPLPEFVLHTAERERTHITESGADEEDECAHEYNTSINNKSNEQEEERDSPKQPPKETRIESSFQIPLPAVLPDVTPSLAVSLSHSTQHAVQQLTHTLADTLSSLCFVAARNVSERVRERMKESVVWHTLQESALSLSLSLSDSLAHTLTQTSQRLPLSLTTQTHSERERAESLHRERLRDVREWRDLLRRVLLSSLTHRERQLVWLTRESDTDTHTDAQALTQSESEDALRERVRACLADLLSIENTVRDGPTHSLTHTLTQTTFELPYTHHTLTQPNDALTVSDHTPTHTPTEAHTPQNAVVLSHSDKDLSSEDELHYLVARYCTPSPFTSLSHNVHNTATATQPTAALVPYNILTQQPTTTTTTSSVVCHQCGHRPTLAMCLRVCARCTRPVCVQHAQRKREIPIFGLLGRENAVRVCDLCARTLDAQRLYERNKWRAARVEDYLCQRLVWYRYENDSDKDRERWKEDKTEKQGSSHAILQAPSLSFSFPTRVVVETIEVLQKNGLWGFASMLLNTDSVESVETAKKILGLDKVLGMSPHEFTACVHYALHVQHSLKGCDPEREHREHSHCREVREAEIALALNYAPLALNTVYLSSCVAMQRQCALQGLRLLYSNCEDEGDSDERDVCGSVVYAVFVTDYDTSHTSHIAHTAQREKEVICVIRGDDTLSLESLASDTHTPPTQFPPSLETLAGLLSLSQPQSLCESASEETRKRWESERERAFCTPALAQQTLSLLRTVGPSLLTLARHAHTITCTGHGRGAALAALLALCLSPFLSTSSHHTLPQKQTQTSTDTPSLTVPPLSFDKFRVFAFSPPPCVDARTAEKLRVCVRTVAVGDSVCVRLGAARVRRTVRELLRLRCEVFLSDKQDWASVMERASHVLPHSTGEKQQQCDESTLCGEEHSTAKTENVCVVQEEPRILADEELPSLSLPGCVWHAYEYRGQWLVRESTAGREPPSLKHVVLTRTSLNDHRPQRILQALLEARAVLRAPVAPSVWQPFSSSETCACCHERFHWAPAFRASASQRESESELLRERENCFHCGALVCGQCCSQERAIPKYGILFPRGLCDLCVMRGDYALIC